MSDECIAGIDIGGTKIALALAAPNGGMITSTRLPTRVETGPHRILENTIAKLREMSEETGTKIAAVGVGCGGPLDRRSGQILSPPNLPDWDRFPIVQLLEEQLGVPVLLDNDANAAALGECQYGAGRGLRDIVYITISTGIGGGLIVDGELVYGVHDGAGEVGHITVLPDGPACGCGARGCLEAICSGTSIARRARERLLEGAPSSLASLVHEAVTAQTVAEAARGGDALAGEVWNETIHYLAIGVGNIINTLAPEAVIIGGGVSAAGEQLFEPLRRQVRDRVKMLPADAINILPASLGGDSGVYGALILGQRAFASRRDS